MVAKVTIKIKIISFLILAICLIQIKIFAQSGAALHFDGIDDRVDLGTTLGNFGTGNFTIETWFKSTATGDRTIIGKRPGCNAGNFWNIRLINGKVYFEVCGNTSQANLLSVQSPLSTYNNGNWTHVACTRNGTVYTLYLNGIAVASGSTGLTNYSNNTPLTIGYGACGYFRVA